MSGVPSSRSIDQWAEHYRCSPRTIDRLRAASVDLEDPAAVALHLASLVRPAVPMLERVHTILEDLGPVARIH
jgi:hypothetical protein